MELELFSRLVVSALIALFLLPDGRRLNSFLCWMGRVCGDSGCFPEASRTANVFKGGQTRVDDALSHIYGSLCCLVVYCWAAAVACEDAISQDALNGTSIKGDRVMLSQSFLRKKSCFWAFLKTAEMFIEGRMEPWFHGVYSDPAVRMLVLKSRLIRLSNMFPLFCSLGFLFLAIRSGTQCGLLLL